MKAFSHIGLALSCSCLTAACGGGASDGNVTVTPACQATFLYAALSEIPSELAMGVTVTTPAAGLGLAALAAGLGLATPAAGLELAALVVASDAPPQAAVRQLQLKAKPIWEKVFIRAPKTVVTEHVQHALAFAA